MRKKRKTQRALIRRVGKWEPEDTITYALTKRRECRRLMRRVLFNFMRPIRR